MKSSEQILAEFDQYETFVKQNNWKDQTLYLVCLGEAIAHEASACMNAINCNDNFYQKFYYYAQAFTFLNSALLRAGEKYANDQQLINYINSKISSIYAEFLNSINVNIIEDNILHRKVELFSLRERIKGAKHLLEQNHGINFCQEENQNNQVSNVRQLYGYMEVEMSAFLGKIIYDSIKILGQPPRKFSVFGLGSLARGEMTPYSDFEWGILIDKSRSSSLRLNIDDKIELILDKYYFRKLASIVQIKIINLGETSLRVVGVEAFKDLYSDGNFDLVSGFCFDAQYKGACRTPLGNNHCEKEEGKSFELICTVNELLAFQNDNWKEVDKMLLLELANIKTINCIHSNQDNNLFKQYKLGLPNTVGIRQEIALELLKSDARKFQHGLGLPVEEGKFYEIKRDFYRLPDRVIENLSIIFGIDEQDPHKRLEELKNNSILNAEGLRNLDIVLSIANYIRLSAYLEAGAREEIMSTSYRTTGEHIQLLFFDTKIKMFFNNNRKPIFRYYFTIIPLYKVLKDFISQNNLDTSVLKQVMRPLFEVTPKAKAMIYARFMDWCGAIGELNKIHVTEIDYGVCMLKGNCFNSQKEPQNALLEFKKAFIFAEALNNKALLAGAYSNYGNVLSIINDNSASSYLEKALVLKKELYENSDPIEYAAELVNFWGDAIQQNLRNKTPIDITKMVCGLKEAKITFSQKKVHYLVMCIKTNLKVMKLYVKRRINQ